MTTRDPGPGPDTAVFGDHPARKWLNPYQREIALVLGADKTPDDLEAVEEAMRTARGTLDGLGPREFAAEARMGWTVVRAGRAMDAAGVTVGHDSFLDPGLHAAAANYVERDQDGPAHPPADLHHRRRLADLRHPRRRLDRGHGRRPRPPTAWPSRPRRAAPRRSGRTCGDLLRPGPGLVTATSAWGACGGRGDICGWSG